MEKQLPKETLYFIKTGSRWAFEGLVRLINSDDKFFLTRHLKKRQNKNDITLLLTTDNLT